MTAGRPQENASLATRVLASALLALFVGGVIASGALRFYAHSGLEDAVLIPFAAFAFVGWLVAFRRPSNPVGWVFLLVGALTGMGAWTEPLINLALDRGWHFHGVLLFAAWYQIWYWYPLLFLSTAYTVLLFPNGLPSRRWRPLLVVMTLGLSVITIASALQPTITVGDKPDSVDVPNPIGVGHYKGDIESSPLFAVGGFVLAACMVAAVVSLVVRFRRSRGIVRAQLKWYALSGAGLVGQMLLSIFVHPYERSSVSGAVFVIVLTAVPVACGLAIFRYRLYDIDRIVSRTVSYAVVTGLIVAMYVGVVALVDGVLGSSSTVAVAASTLAAAAAFQPLRKRVQRTVDRRFDRAAYDARRTVERFSSALRDEVDVDAVRDDLLTTVTFAVAPTSVSIWLAHR